MKICEPLNPYILGIARTIKATYQKNSPANFVRNGSMAATAVIEYDTDRGHSEDTTLLGATMTKVIEVYEEDKQIRSKPFKGQEGKDSEERV